MREAMAELGLEPRRDVGREALQAGYRALGLGPSGHPDPRAWGLMTTSSSFIVTRGFGGADPDFSWVDEPDYDEPEPGTRDPLWQQVVGTWTAAIASGKSIQVNLPPRHGRRSTMQAVIDRYRELHDQLAGRAPAVFPEDTLLPLSVETTEAIRKKLGQPFTPRNRRERRDRHHR